MKQLICFDCDETLLSEEMENEGQYIKGIISTQVLIDLENKGYKIAMVSPSPFIPKQYRGENYWFKRNAEGFCRLENIRDAQRHHNVDDNNTIYVDDLKGVLNMIQSQSNITCFTPEEFLDSIEQKQ